MSRFFASNRLTIFPDQLAFDGIGLEQDERAILTWPAAPVRDSVGVHAVLRLHPVSTAAT